MKKQFFRVKQLADQTFSRAGKTEALSDDLQDAERRVEFIRNVCLNAGKKLTNPNAGHESAREKRLKKTPEHLLGNSMLENVGSEDDHLLRQVVTDCGKLQLCLANAIVEHEIKVESKVVGPLINVCDNDYPNIMKLKRNLSKLILDMDSARARYHQATAKHSGTGNTGSKADSIKDELEEAEAKVEQCRDALACEMLQLIAREADLSSTFLEYARLQKNYHITATKILDEIIPEMEEAINESYMRPVFGRPLEDHLRVTSRKIAYPIELCVCGLLELGIAEEGLFRVAPGASKLRRMKLSLDAHCLDFVSALQIRDPHVFAGVLKSYLRELPEPLLTHDLYDQWMAAAMVMGQGNKEEGLNAFWNVLHSLPQANFDNLQYLIKFLASLASNKQSNKMSPQNIAIVIAPNLIWSPNEDTSNIGHNMTTANYHTGIVETLISYSDWFFPGDVDFYVTLIKEVGQRYLNGHGVPGDPQSQSMEDKTMKRTQSNDSLSDHNSPPHGSPKPAVRSRKHNKSTAPNPPGMPSRDKEEFKEKSSNRESKDFSRLMEKPKEKVSKEKEKEVEKEKVDDKLEKKENRPPPPKDMGKSPLKEESTKKTEVKVVETRSGGGERRSSKEDNKLVGEANSLEFEHFEGAKGSGMDLNKRTSKSGEDVRKMKVEDGGYCTLRKPPRPMPRTVLGDAVGEKPAVPERPPQLQRPLSFRIPKSPDSLVEDRNVSLERTHMYSVDKQQVAIIQVNSEKVPIEKSIAETSEKPEKPKKPETLMTQPGHQRAASEGSIIDTSGSSRPPRPTPPPPPVTSPTKKDNTDL
ncbi:rho GTPase-activating protein 44 [Halyomorpha halys]|uniref:rho GTPase-activating protein 44 n=1 Tax=Halyomorpha halys TaxID=286706 RepID=UPI0006D4EF7B